MQNYLENEKTCIFAVQSGLDIDELRAISQIRYENFTKGRQEVTTIFMSEKAKVATYNGGDK